jgi:hypothetical protein
VNGPGFATEISKAAMPKIKNLSATISLSGLEGQSNVFLY